MARGIDPARSQQSFALSIPSSVGDGSPCQVHEGVCAFSGNQIKGLDGGIPAHGFVVIAWFGGNFVAGMDDADDNVPLLFCKLNQGLARQSQSIPS